MLFFTVCRDYEGKWHVSSFGGRNAAEEEKFALAGYAEVSMVTTDYDKAEFRRRRLNAESKKNDLSPQTPGEMS